MIEIKSIEDFKKYKTTEGYFIITDTTGRKVHSSKCHTVDISNFRIKVAENANKNGYYFYTNDLIEAKEFPKVKQCEKCRRLL